MKQLIILFTLITGLAQAGTLQEYHKQFLEEGYTLFNAGTNDDKGTTGYFAVYVNDSHPTEPLIYCFKKHSQKDASCYLP